MEYNKALDGVRGVALLAVLAGHSSVFFTYSPHKLRYQEWINGGAMGVNLFLVLSGFLITTKLIEMRQQRGAISLRTFFVNRATRLLPALYTMLVVYTVFNLLFGPSWASMWPTLLAAILYYVNWLPTFSTQIAFDLTPLWSLSLEEQFYFTWPVIMMFLLKRSVRVVIFLLAVCFVALGAWRAFQYETKGLGFFAVFPRTDIQLDGLMIGALLAFVFRTYVIPPLVARILVVVGGATVLMNFLFGSVFYPYTQRMGLSVFNVACAMVVLSVATYSGRISRWLGSRPLILIGRFSYGLYLWHLPIWAFVVTHSGLRHPVPLAALGLSTTAVTVAISWRFIEQPAMRLRPRLIGRIS